MLTAMALRSLSGSLTEIVVNFLASFWYNRHVKTNNKEK